MKLTDEFLKMALKDLKATEVLYKATLYPQAMFYFAQSVEKANKALALTSGKYTEEDMLKIRHDSTRIYRDNIIELKQRYELLTENLSQIPELKKTEFIQNLDIEDKIEELEQGLREFADIQNGKIDLVFISTKEIQIIFNSIEEREMELEDEMKNIDDFKLTDENWNSCKIEVLEQLKTPDNHDFAHMLENEMNEIDISVPELEVLIKKMYLQMFHCMNLLFPLYHLAVITLPHSIITRYPKGDLYPTKTYTRKLPIVRNLPDLINLQFKMLFLLNIYCEEFIFKQEN